MSNQVVPPRGDKRRIRQSPNRASYDTKTLYETLDKCNIGHVSFVQDNWPQSVPTAIARIDHHLYLHGHSKSRLYKALSNGERVCVSACRVDALVKARSAFHCSMNYRSAVVFGQASSVEEGDKSELLDRFTEHLIPGSLGHFRPHHANELKATSLVRIPLNDFSVKIRTGDPIDDDEDLNLLHWAGVIPIQSVYGKPIASANLQNDSISIFQLPSDAKP